MGDAHAPGTANRAREFLLPDHRSPHRNAGTLEEIGLTRLPHFTVLRDWFENISMERYRAFLGVSVEKCIGHAALVSAGFNRDHPQRYYAQRAHYLVRSLKVTAFVDVETMYVTDVHCTITRKHDAKIGSQVEGDEP